MVVLTAFNLGSCSKKDVPLPAHGGVYRSESAGATFFQSVTIEGKEGQYIAQFPLGKIDRSVVDPSILFISAGNRGMVVSKNNGATWTQIGTPLAQTLDVVELENRTLVVSGTDANGQGYIVRSLDEGKSWQTVYTEPLPKKPSGHLNLLSNSDPVSSLVVLLARDPFDGNHVYAATNLGTVLSGEQSAKVWRTSHRLAPADTYSTSSQTGFGIRKLVPSPFQKNELLVVTYSRQLMRVKNDKDELIEVPAVIGGEELSQFAVQTNRKVDDVSYVPTFPNALLVTGEKGVVVTRDKGKTWVDLKVPVDPSQAFSTMFATVSPTNVNRMLVAVDAVIYRSEDGGQTWNTLSFELPDFAITQLSIDPRNASNVLAVTVAKKS